MVSELNETQLKAIEMLASGENQSNTAKLLGVNPKTIGRWMKDKKFKAELDKCVQLATSKVSEKILLNIAPLTDRLVRIALKSNSDKTALDAIIYALNRVCGTPTNKTQDVTESDGNKKEPIDIDKAIENIKNTNNIVELPKTKDV